MDIVTLLNDVYLSEVF